ncbi:MAG TPA: LCP family protein [Candidatus Limnocylindrales bacterium]
MHSSQGPLPRARSAFAASFLSLLFPGLGHAYDGAWERALGFAAAPLLLLSLIAGLAFSLRLELLGIVVQPWALALILVADAGLLVYRALAAVDAYRVAQHLNALEATGGRLGRARIHANPLSLAGLVAVLLVIAAGHVAVAWYDLQAYDLVNCVFDSSGQASCDSSQGPGGSPGASSGQGSGDIPSAGASGGASASGLSTPPPGATAAPSGSTATWNGRDRLNILLVGTDQRPKENTFNTDTMIVVSVDPTTKQVAMFQVPRDTVDLPLPPGPARNVFGATYSAKINSLWMQAASRPDVFPGTTVSRGPNALKSTLGYLYGLDIQWYVEVNFDGFRRIVDTLGGVTINVQTPVMDDHYPGDNGRPIRVYIPAGIQHFDGAGALIYARSRHASNDFDRGARQQRVLVSLKDQTDFSTVVSRLTDLIAALKTAVHTDIPVSELPALVDLASKVDSTNIHSFVFAPPLYQKEVTSGDPRGYVIIPYVGKIRAAVATAFTVSPGAEADRERIAAENATVWVLNGSGRQGQAADVAAYLSSLGVDALAPNQRPDSRPATTTIVAYNGAETRMTETVKLLATVFGVTPTPRVDPNARADFVVTTSPGTPDLTAPPAP